MYPKRRHGSRCRLKLKPKQWQPKLNKRERLVRLKECIARVVSLVFRSRLPCRLLLSVVLLVIAEKMTGGALAEKMLQKYNETEKVVPKKQEGEEGEEQGAKKEEDKGTK